MVIINSEFYSGQKFMGRINKKIFTVDKVAMHKGDICDRSNNKWFVYFIIDDTGETVKIPLETAKRMLLDEIEDWEYYEENEYGPSNPWDAPGMRISDFI